MKQFDVTYQTTHRHIIHATSAQAAGAAMAQAMNLGDAFKLVQVVDLSLPADHVCPECERCRAAFEAGEPPDNPMPPFAPPTGPPTGGTHPALLSVAA